MINTKKLTVTMPLDVYQSIKDKAERAGRSLNSIFLQLIKEGHITLFTDLQEVCRLIYQLNAQLANLELKYSIDKEFIAIKEEVNRLCQYLRYLMEAIKQQRG